MWLLLRWFSSAFAKNPGVWSVIIWSSCKWKLSHISRTRLALNDIATIYLAEIAISYHESLALLPYSRKEMFQPCGQSHEKHQKANVLTLISWQRPSMAKTTDSTLKCSTNNTLARTNGTKIGLTWTKWNLWDIDSWESSQVHDIKWEMVLESTYCWPLSWGFSDEVWGLLLIQNWLRFASQLVLAVITTVPAVLISICLPRGSVLDTCGKNLCPKDRFMCKSQVY